MCFPVKQNPSFSLFRGKCGAVGRRVLLQAIPRNGGGRRWDTAPRRRDSPARRSQSRKRMRAREGRLGFALLCRSRVYPGSCCHLMVQGRQWLETKALPGTAEPLRQQADIPPRFFKESDLEATEAPGRLSLAPNNIF